MYSKDAIKGVPRHGRGQAAVPAVLQATCRPTATTSGTDREVVDHVWVAAYEREEAEVEGEFRKVDVAKPAGRVARAAKWLLVEGVCRGLVPGRLVAAALGRWPRLRSA